MQTNSTLSRGQQKVATTVDEDFAWFDELDRPLKVALWEYAQRMDSRAVSLMSAARGVSETLYQLMQQERREIMRFASQYRSLTTQVYPFVAAQATIQRYGFGRYRPQREISMRVPDAPRWRKRRYCR
jgi:hypothetical protein